MRKRNAATSGRRRMAALAVTACAGALALPAVATAELPDGRVYEMVTPYEKGGYDITAWANAGSYANAAVDGERLNFGLYGNIEGGTSSQLGTSLLQATRTPAGWTSKGTLPRFQPGAPYRSDSGQGVQLVETPDLRTTVVLSSQPATAGALVGRWNLFSRDGDGAFSLLAPDLGPYEDYLGFADPSVSDDGRHVLFQTDVQLTPDAAAGVTNLYESVDGVTRLAGVLPDGSAPPAGSTSAGLQHNRTISADGSRVFFISGGELYLRTNGQQTVRVSRPYDDGGGNVGTPGNASYVWATPDGSKVAFISSGRLTPDATLGNDAYLFDVATQRLTNLTAASGRTAAILTIVGISEDGGTVYFLAPALPNVTPFPAGTVRAIWAWHEGQLRLVSGMKIGQTETAETLSSFVAASGQLLFHTSASHPGYPMTGANLATSRLRVFLYDPAGSGRATCLSCKADGTADNVDSFAGDLRAAQGELFGGRRSHAISDDGRRAWFETVSALLPADENGRLDVYQWADGQGLSLISTGRSPNDSYLGDASADGEDVFFFTREQLAAEDTDDLLDVYDARVGGGLPSRRPPERDRTCPAAGCQGDPTPRPVDRDAGSVTDPSDGDVTDPIAPADPIPFELTVTTLGKQAGPRLARSGVLSVRFNITRKTKATVLLQVRRGGRWVAAGSTTRTPRGAGGTTVRVALSKQARRQLKRTRRLAVRVEVRAGGQVRRQQLMVTAPGVKKGKGNG